MTVSHKLNLINWGFVPGNLFQIIQVPINYEKRKYWLAQMFINPLAPELFFFLISAHSVYKM